MRVWKHVISIVLSLMLVINLSVAGFTMDVQAEEVKQESVNQPVNEESGDEAEKEAGTSTEPEESKSETEQKEQEETETKEKAEAEAGESEVKENAKAEDVKEKIPENAKTEKTETKETETKAKTKAEARKIQAKVNAKAETKAKEGDETPKTEENAQVYSVDGISLEKYEMVLPEGKTKDDIVAGDEITVKLTVKNNYDFSEGIYQDSVWIHWDIGEEQRTLRSQNITEEVVSIKAGETRVIEVPVTINQYFPAGGEAKLNNIAVAYKYYNRIAGESGQDVLVDDTGERKSYNGELDFNLTVSEEVDTTAPEITRIKVLNSGKIDVGTPVQLEVSYKDDYSGVSSISIQVHNKNTNATYFKEYKVAEEGKEGYVTVEIDSRELEPGEYTVDYIEASDHTNNVQFYSQLEGSENLQDNQGNTLENVTFEVNPLEECVQIKNVRLEKDGQKAANLTFEAGDNFELVVELENKLDESYEASLYNSYIDWSTLNGERMNFDNIFGEEDIVTVPAGGTKELRYPVSLDKYMIGGNYTLSNIEINNDTDENRLIYNRNVSEDGTVETSGSYGGMTILQDFDASKADFTVVNNGTVDKEAPKLTSLKLLNPDSIYAGDEIQIEAGYSDDASGVKSIYLSFVNGLWADIELDEEGKKEGTAVLRGTAWDVGKYKVESVQIEDYAGHIRNYFTDNNGNVVDESVESEGDTVKCPTFEAKYFDKVLSIESVRLEKDGVVKNEFSVGDTFELVVKVKNNTGETYEVDAAFCYAEWETMTSGSNGTMRPGEPGDNIITIKNQETRELRFPMEVGKYSGKEKWNLSAIYISDNSEEKDVSYHKYFYEEDGENLTEEILTYGEREINIEMDASQADFTVIGALERDDEAPYIESISAENAVAPGKLTFNIKVDKDNLGSAPPDYVDITIADINNEKNTIMFSGGAADGNVSYDVTTGMCTYTVELNDLIWGSAYKISYISISDEAGNFRTYDEGEGEKLVDSEGGIENPDSFDNIKINIENTGNPNADFDGPILTGLSIVEKNLDKTKKLQCRVKVDDTTGLSRIMLDFYTPEHDGLKAFESWDYEKDRDEYVFSFDLTECENGSYELSELYLFDDSGRENMSNYIYDREKQQFYMESDGGDKYVSFKGNYDFKIQEHTHKWNTGTITTKPTCTKAGVKTYKCTHAGCTQTKTESVAKLPHSYKSTVTKSTCAKQGSTKYTCTGCGHSYSTPLPAVSHNYKTSVTASTCAKQGNTRYTCTGCGHSYSKALPLLSHSYTTVTTKATTSKRNGSIVKKCRTCGKVASKSTIYYPKTVKLSTTSYTYNGKTKKPSVKVVGSNRKTISKANYKVSYSSGRKNVGRYKVKVTFKGNYSGSISKTFDIKPKSTSVSKVSSGRKKAVVRWKKQTKQTTGYQIQYSTDKKFRKGNKTVTIKKNRTTSKTITKLKSKKKYYVRVRTYKKAKYGRKYINEYSSWSKVKSVRVR